jgi:putative transcriptional regulator
MSVQIEKPAKGCLLIAEPFLGDPSFERTVIVLTDHHEDGSVGFVLNRPLDLRMEQVLDGFPKFEEQLFYGGPVQQNNLYYLHNRGDLIPESVEIMPNLFWGGKLSAVKEMLQTGIMNESDIRFYLGYSGWGKGQLEGEITENSWLIVKTQKDLLAGSTRTLWKELMLDIGGDYRLWANSPSDPILN